VQHRGQARTLSESHIATSQKRADSLLNEIM